MLAVFVIVAINIPKSGLLGTFPTCCGGDTFWSHCVPWTESKKDFPAGTMASSSVTSK